MATLICHSIDTNYMLDQDSESFFLIIVTKLIQVVISNSGGGLVIYLKQIKFAHASCISYCHSLKSESLVTIFQIVSVMTFFFITVSLSYFYLAYHF